VHQAGEAPGMHAQNLKTVRILDEWGDACIGTIRIDEQRKQFYAYCCHLGQPGNHDHRTATMTECRLNRKPTAKSTYLGQQVQWLRQSTAFVDRASHLDSLECITREERIRCRQCIRDRALTDPGMLHLLEREASFLGVPWHGVDTVQE
jgi:hypothetical protein